ncbi:MAG TPA: hypothetical protein DCL54_10635 [Alphaproteobacteria bacterium]|nr:hypothetical protein [Alphaproteobacteria bacterium]
MSRALPWVLSAYIAFVFVQSLFFKFAAADESIYIFQTIENWLGLDFFEPFMRNFIGASEMLCSVLLFIPVTRPLGALGSLIIISGAAVFHLFSPLGIEVQGDGGTLFILALGVMAASATIIYLERNNYRTLPQRLGYWA